MEKKQTILESRKRLDATLCLPDLVNEDSIASLIKEQLIRSSLRNKCDIGMIIESRTKEVSNFLEMLRSASGSCSSNIKFHKDWKVKQDTDQLRVMYCEGPHGSPFHTLLAEGFADGPLDVCLCATLELTLYKKWWPQYNVPTFKIIASSCLQKVGIGEEISLIRMKVPWPISDREAVLHYFEMEYIKEDLILVLIKTLSETEPIDAETHGFSRDGIPQANDTIRIDLVGGVVLQKVENNRCYFRLIFNFDIKLDFLPPALINFISRQLVGNGHKLFQKAVRSVVATDADYCEALQRPLYARIRRQLHSLDTPATSLEDLDKEKLEEHTDDAIVRNRIVDTSTSIPEITEDDAEQRRPDDGLMNKITNGLFESPAHDEHCLTSSKEKSSISPEVEHALGILDQVFTIVQGKNGRSSSPEHELAISEPPAKTIILKNGDELESYAEGSSSTEDNRQRKMSYSILESRHNEVTISSQNERIILDLEKTQLVESKFVLPSKTYVRVAQPPALDSHGVSKVCDEDSLKANNNGPPTKKKKGKNLFPCCLSPSFLKDDISKDTIE